MGTMSGAYPNGTTATYGYDGAKRITRIANMQGASTVSSYDYTYDGNGNRLTQIETNGGSAQTTTYQYDADDRLTDVLYPDADTSYTYDANYNRLTEKTVENGTGATVVDKTYAYNARNELTSVTDAANSANNATYQYDANGNQTVKSKNGTVTTFLYDVRDQLIAVRQATTTLGQYQYDYAGLRVAKTGTNGLVRYTYDGKSVLVQTDGTGKTLAKYNYGPDHLLSLDQATQGRQYYLFDALGSTVDLTTTTGTIQARYQYDAWGNLRAHSGSSWNEFTYTGHEKDPATGLYYFKARYYDPDTGRFLSQDSYGGKPDNPPSLHTYLYAYANPTVYVDPTGHYDEAGHYYTTYYIALNLGYSKHNARQIAYFAELPDKVTKYDAINAETNVFDPQYDTDRNRVQRDFHTLTGRSSAAETKESEAIVRNAKDLAVLGFAIHRLGDSYAHRVMGDESRMYSTGLGHLSDGHDPDYIHLRPKLYRHYVRDLVNLLGEKRGLTKSRRNGIAQKTIDALNKVIAQAVRSNTKTVMIHGRIPETYIDNVGADRAIMHKIATLIRKEKPGAIIDKPELYQYGIFAHHGVRQDIRGFFTATVPVETAKNRTEEERTRRKRMLGLLGTSAQEGRLSGMSDQQIVDLLTARAKYAARRMHEMARPYEDPAYRVPSGNDSGWPYIMYPAHHKNRNHVVIVIERK